MEQLKTHSEEELSDLRMKQLKNRKCEKFLKELCFNLIFLGVLFAIAYTNGTTKAYSYQNQILTSFSEFDEVCLL